MSHCPAKELLATYLFSLLSGQALALPDATADSADRFPFVVEVLLQDHLICSGTVLYPRIVVTAAHCLQQKLYWRGGQFYTNSFVSPSDLSVSVVLADRSETYAVEDTSISPGWLALNQEAGLQSFPYDLALVITERPIEVELPSSLVRASAGKQAQASSETEAPVRHGLLVAFGGQHCSSAIECEDAGVRRFVPVAIKDNVDCFKMRGPEPPLSPNAVWCIDSAVMPGDSGGALMIETRDGQLTYAGVISAQGGLPPELGAVAHWRRSLAAGLSTNLPFIAQAARALGYAP